MKQSETQEDPDSGTTPVYTIQKAFYLHLEIAVSFCLDLLRIETLDNDV